MRNPERLVKHVHLLPRSPSECRSDDVSTTAPRGTLPHSVHRVTSSIAVYRAPFEFEYPIIAHEKYSRLIQLFVFYMILIKYPRTFRALLMASLALVKSYIICAVLVNIINNCLCV